MSTETSATERLEQWLLEKDHSRHIERSGGTKSGFVVTLFDGHRPRHDRLQIGEGLTLDAAIHAALDAAGAER